MKTNSENNNGNIQEVISSLEKHLNFKLWGFELEFACEKFPPYVVYRSKKCLVRFSWYQTRSYEKPSIEVCYGRLHAPFDQDTMMWNEQKCYCWHIINNILIFLDEESPLDISIQNYVNPKILRGFRQENNGKAFSLGEYAAKEQAVIWECYGSRFFDLFDLQRPELWDEYSKFLKSYYEDQDQQAKLKGFTPIILELPLYMVC